MTKKQPLAFALTSTYDERSKDSHVVKEIFSLKDGVLRRENVHRGFPDDREESWELKPGRSATAAILQKLEALGLLMNYAKAHPVDAGGFVVSTHKHLVVQTGGNKFEITVSGGRPADIKDEVHDKLSAFQTFARSLFPA